MMQCLSKHGLWNTLLKSSDSQLPRNLKVETYLPRQTMELFLRQRRINLLQLLIFFQVADSINTVYWLLNGMINYRRQPVLILRKEAIHRLQEHHSDFKPLCFSSQTMFSRHFSKKWAFLLPRL